MLGRKNTTYDYVRVGMERDGLFTPENVRHYCSFLRRRLQGIVENDGGYIEGRGHNRWAEAERHGLSVSFNLSGS